MLIVLEGCDGSGKTTLATQLSKLLDATVIHCSTHTPNDYEFFTQLIKLSEDRNVIADRWCYGQFVYQEPDYRPLEDENHYAEENLNRLENIMLLANVKVIFVTAPDEVIKKRLGARAEVPINGLTVEEIQRRFRDLKNHSMLTWLEYNTGGEGNV